MGYVTDTEDVKQPIPNKKKTIVGFTLGWLCLVLVVLVTIVDPSRLITRYCSRVAYGSYVHEGLKVEFPSVKLATYLFNITNGDRFLAGEDTKLKVEEVGPFTYEEFRTNEDLEIDEEAGVMRYTPSVRPVFRLDESVARPEDVNIIMPNIAMLSLASKLSSYSYIPRLGYNLLVAQLQSKPLVKMTASEYMWGYNEPLITLGNTIIPGQINFDTFGILDRLYDTKLRNRVEVSARIEDRCMIRSVNKCDGLEMWDYEDPDKRSRCNSFNDTYEGILYPIDLTPETPIRIYRNVLCRIIDLEFQEKVTMDYGAEGLFYKISNKTFNINNDTQCLCNQGICSEGLSDMSPCFYGFPVVLSNAHFLDTDPKLFEHIEGMKPNEEEHGSQFIMDPIIGLALKTQFSVQMNVYVSDVSFNPETSVFSNMIVPVAYFKIIQPPLDEKQLYNLKKVYVIGPYAMLGTKVALVLLGLVLLAFYGRLIYCNWMYPRRDEKKGVTFDLASVDKPCGKLQLVSK